MGNYERRDNLKVENFERETERLRMKEKKRKRLRKNETGKK